jgi:hypothetical protein
MSTIIVSVILVGSIIAVCLLLISVAKKQKNKKMNQLLNRFNELGIVYNLSFSSQEFFNNTIIGLDGINRKLLVLEQTSNTGFDDYVLALDEVKNCTIMKHYGNINPGDLKNKHLETYLERIVLHFEFKTGTEPVEVGLYNHIDDNIYCLADIQRKAQHWQQILVKMLGGASKRIA